MEYGYYLSILAKHGLKISEGEKIKNGILGKNNSTIHNKL
jgi:hypothetical protein